MIIEPPAITKPVKIKIVKISREGRIDLEFNQEMVTPFSNKRLLSQSLKLSDLDPSRDIIDIAFRSKEESSNFVRFTVDIIDWNSTAMVLYCNFTNP